MSSGANIKKPAKVANLTKMLGGTMSLYVQQELGETGEELELEAEEKVSKSPHGTGCQNSRK